MSSVPPRVATPPTTLSPTLPPELSPPPAQLLGSDDEEQEDPSDYCKGDFYLPGKKKSFCVNLGLLIILIDIIAYHLSFASSEVGP